LGALTDLGANSRGSESKLVFNLGRIVMNVLKTFALAMLLALPLTVGCGQESSRTTTETVETPQGQTTVTTEQKVETSGEHPPAAPNP
jgi:hypothetical protein